MANNSPRVNRYKPAHFKRSICVHSQFSLSANAFRGNSSRTKENYAKSWQQEQGVFNCSFVCSNNYTCHYTSIRMCLNHDESSVLSPLKLTWEVILKVEDSRLALHSILLLVGERCKYEIPTIFVTWSKIVLPSTAIFMSSLTDGGHCP